MGTLLSIIPMSGFGQDNSNLEQCFERGLKAAAKRQHELSIVASGEKNNVVDPLLRKLMSTTQEPNSNFPNRNRSQLEGSVSEASTRNNRRRADKDTKKTESAKCMQPAQRKLDINSNPKVTVSNKAIDEPSKPSKPFQPESWPPVAMIQEQIAKHQTIFPTTIILARFMSNRAPRKYVEIRYSTDNTNATFFDSSDKLDTLITIKDEKKMGESQDEQVRFFLLILKTGLNILQGHVWWNGFSFILDSNVKNRLKVSALETQPISQLLFELTGMKELEVHRTIHRVELRGQIDGSSDCIKYIRVRGAFTKPINVKQLRSNLITLHLPTFSPEFISY